METVFTPERKERLRLALASGSRLGATDIRLINIDVYRKRLGAQWPKYKSIIHSYFVQAIGAEIGPRDFYIQTRNGYAIFFFDCSLPQVRDISGRIAAKIDEYLSGDPAFADPKIVCHAVPVDCRELLAQLEVDQRLTSIPAPVTPRASNAPERVQNHPYIYVPLWHAKLERVVGSIHGLDSPAALRRKPDREYYASGIMCMQDDVARFNSMLSDAYKLHKAGQSATILFSLNFTSFCESRLAQEYMQVMRQTPASLLQYLTPRFVRIPPGTPRALLAGSVEVLTAIFKNIALQVRPPVDPRTLEYVPCSILAMSWSDVVHAAGNNTLACERVVRQFCNTARALRANSLIVGIDSPAAFEVAATGNPQFMSGHAVIPAASVAPKQHCVTFADIRAAHRQRCVPSEREIGSDVEASV